MKKLSKRDRRALYGGVGLTAVLVVVFFIVLPFYDTTAQTRSELDQKKRLLNRSVDTIGEVATYQARLEELQGALGQLERRLLEASSTNVAETRLLELLSEMAEDNDVTITRSNPVPEQVDGNYTKVTLQVNLECGIEALTGFLRSITSNDTFLSVEEFNLNMGRGRRRRTGLRPRIRVSAFVRLS